MNKREPEQNHLKDYKFLYISGILLVLVISAYFKQFSSEGVGGQSVWGQFGDFMGGVLNPLLSFIVIWILVEDLRHTKTNLQSSIQEQKNATEAMTAQVIIMTPKPELIIYPFRRLSFWEPGGDVYEYYIVVENIGKKSAEEILVNLKLLKQHNKIIPYDLSILAPGQKHHFFLGVVPQKIRTEEVFSFSTEIQISYSNTTENEKNRSDLTLTIGEESFDDGLLN